MVDGGILFGGEGRSSPDEELFAQEFDKADRADLAKLIREGLRSRCFDMAIYADPLVREDFDNLVAGAWKVIHGMDSEFMWDELKSRVGKRQTR